MPVRDMAPRRSGSSRMAVLACGRHPDTRAHGPRQNVAMRRVAAGSEADGTIRYEAQEFVFYVLTRERWVDGWSS